MTPKNTFSISSDHTFSRNERRTLNAAAAGRPPRILVLSASVGTGHLRAAEALVLALKQLAPEALVETADVLTLATRPFRYCYAQIYLDLVHWAPQLLGAVYDFFDRPSRVRPSMLHRLEIWLQQINMGPYVRLLQSQPWDVVINTFFLSAGVNASLKQRGLLRSPQVMVVTDFETHRQWVAEPCELYCTATEESARYLHFYGVPTSSTAVTGIPIHPVFSQPKKVAECRARLGLTSDKPVVLLLAGGHGAGPIEAPYKALLETEIPLQIVAVTGHNEQAHQQLASLTGPARHSSRVLGFTDRMDNLLTAADLVVTKPGGLAISEALARGAGLVLINPIPGQEERNSDYLLEEGAATKVNHLPMLPFKLASLLEHPDRVDRLRANARRLARPEAAFDIARRALALAREHDLARGHSRHHVREGAGS